jgi:hypothetical protein
VSHYGQSDLPGSGTHLGDLEQCELGKTHLVLLLEAVILPVQRKKNTLLWYCTRKSNGNKSYDT